MDTAKPAGSGRVFFYAFAGAALFAALAALFAAMLRPVMPAKAFRAEAVADRAGAPVSLAPREDVSARDGEPLGPVLPDGPLIAIVMTELGNNPALSARAIERLPAAIAFTFTPYAAGAGDLAARAKADGHEIFMSLPMQPKSYPRVRPGRNTLLVGNDAQENLRRLDWALGRVEGLDGATGMMGSAFTEDGEALAPIMAELERRGLAFIDARASGRTVAEAAARAAGVPSRTNDRFLDEPATAANIGRGLAALVETAKRRGWAIGYARPLAPTIEALADFETEAQAAGVNLVGAARLARGLHEDG